MLGVAFAVSGGCLLVFIRARTLALRLVAVVRGFPLGSLRRLVFVRARAIFCALVRLLGRVLLLGTRRLIILLSATFGIVLFILLCLLAFPVALRIRRSVTALLPARTG